jgi:hypothetical protein
MPIAIGMAVTPTSSRREAETAGLSALPSRPRHRVIAAPQASHRVAAQHRAPAPRGEPPVREQQDHQREHGERERPQRGHHQGGRAERHVVAEVIAERRVVPGVDRDQEQHDEPDQDPAHGVPRLVPRDDDADAGVDQRDGNPGRDVEERRLVDEGGQRGGGAHEHEHQHAQSRGGRRRGQPGMAAGGR